MNNTTRPADRPHSLLGGLIVLVSLCAPGSAGAQSPASATVTVPAAARASDAQDETIRIVAVGDIMMGTAFPDSTYLDPRIVPGVSPAELIGADLVEVLRSGDVVFGNLEGALFDKGGESKRCRNMDACYAFRSPEWYAGLLSGMGFNLMSLANNHSGDFLEAGRATTIAALEEHGIVYGGLAQAGAITGTLELDDGTRVGLAGRKAACLAGFSHGRSPALRRAESWRWCGCSCAAVPNPVVSPTRANRQRSRRQPSPSSVPSLQPWLRHGASSCTDCARRPVCSLRCWDC